MFVEEKTLKDLEWYTVLNDLAGHASSEAGKQLCLNLVPSSDSELVKETLSLTTEAKNLIQQAMDPPLGGIFNLQTIMRDAEKGVTLEDKDFMAVGSTLTTAQKLKEFFIKHEEASPGIAKEAMFIQDHTRLLNEIYRCFDAAGNLQDTASVQLKQLRDSLKSQTNNLKDQLNSILHSSSVIKFLQEPVYTIRNDRYVLPVKAENKSNVPGIVHDSSASGATIFIEPRAIVELNNTIKEIELNIDHEIQRILAELTHKVAQNAETIHINLDILARIDLCFAKGRYSRAIDAGEPEINTSKIIHLKLVRHPILMRTLKNVVANTITLGQEYNTLIITGANAGGKTVLLKTIGLCTLMAGSGMHIPADTGSSVHLYSALFSDIGEKQSLEQNLSTFSAHMSNIIMIVNKAHEDTLVLLDELGAGTDPAEGTALAQSLLEYLHNRGTNTVVTTHYGGLKTLAFSHKGFYNASVEFDLETLRPTFKLLMGIPGKSNATTIAKNLGLKKDIVERAREIYRTTEDDFSLMLDEFQKVQRDVAKEYEKAKSKHEYAEYLKKQYEQHLEKFNATRNQALNSFRRNLNTELNKARSEVIEVLDELKADRTEKTAKRAHAKIAGVQHKTKKKIEKYEDRFEDKSELIPVNWEKAKVGDQVYIKQLDQMATLASMPDKNNRVEVQLGLMKSTVKANELYASTKPQKQSFEPSFRVQGSVTKRPRRRDISHTCDIRGKTVEEGLSELELYLDQAALSAMSPINIIHGHGSGALRKAVREYLKNSLYVESYRPGEYTEGGDGITVVNLR
jgi:DNA mismatch repair protein MutS2